MYEYAINQATRSLFHALGYRVIPGQWQGDSFTIVNGDAWVVLFRNNNKSWTVTTTEGWVNCKSLAEMQATVIMELGTN